MSVKTIEPTHSFNGGAQLPLLPSAASLATDSSGNIVAGSGSSASAISFAFFVG